MSSSNMKHAQQTTEDAKGNNTNVGEDAMDQKGHFRKVIKRKTSQPDNPLLNGSDEDDTYDGTFIGPGGHDSRFGSIDSIGEK